MFRLTIRTSAHAQKRSSGGTITQRPDKSSTIYVFFQVKEFELRTVGLSVTIFKVSKHGIIRAFANTSDSFLVIIRFLSAENGFVMMKELRTNKKLVWMVLLKMCAFNTK